MPFTPIHRLLGRDADDLSIELFQAAVDAHLEEQTDLEWKTRLEHQKPTWQAELAKDLAAMANSGGGWIIYGIGEGSTAAGGDDGRAEHLIGVSDARQTEQRIRDIAWNWVSPALLQVRAHTITADDIAAVAVHVPASADAPHLARMDKGPERVFRAPVRDGAHTRNMSEAELERAYQGRFRERERIRAQLVELYEATNELAPAPVMMRFVGVAVPRKPRPLSAGRLDGGEALRVLAHARSLAGTYAADPQVGAYRLRHAIPEAGAGQVAVHRGLRRWKVESGGDRLDGAAVHFDGAVTLTADIDSAVMRHPQQVSSGRVATQDIEARIGGLIALVMRAQRDLGVVSDYDIQVGLEWADRRQALTVLRPDGSAVEPAVRRFVPVRTTLPADATNEVGWEIAHDLALDVLNQGGVHGGTVLRAPADGDVPGEGA